MKQSILISKNMTGLLLVVLMALSGHAAAEPPAIAPATMPAGSPDPSLDAKANSGRNDLFKEILGAAESQLADHPPTWPMPPERRLALLALDGIMNDPFVTERPALQDFFHHRFKLALEQIQTTTVAPGQMRIWQIYSMGFIVKTASVTAAFDLVAPSHLGKLAVPSDLMRALVEQCDVLFVSHEHQDHADPMVFQMFVDSGKPILGPAGMEAVDPIFRHVLPLKPDTEKSYSVQTRHAKLEVWIFPGRQEVMPKPENGLKEITFVANNVYVVKTPEGLVISHNGDQSDAASWEWIDQLHQRVPRINVMIFNAWSNPVARYVKGYAPEMMIYAHMNELGHKITGRYPYWKALQKGQKTKVPFYVMTWGESMTYPSTR